MPRQLAACGILVLIATTALQAAAPARAPAQAGAMEAIQKAADAGKYLFLLVCDKDDEAARTAGKVVEAADVFTLFDSPRNAYTASLLAAARRLHQTKMLGGAAPAAQAPP